MKTNSCADIRKTRPFLRKTLCQALAVAGLLGSLCAMPAFADDAADVSKLLKGGHFSEALTKANTVLAQKPRDAQMRFLKGVALTEMNKPSEAIAIFARLSEDFPDLPEPHNNLAVLYASSGQFDKARASLDMAMRTNPSYATALENLGDVNARIASQAYDKALQLDTRNANAKSKLTLLTALGNGSKAASASASAAVPAVPAAPATAPVVATVAKAPVQAVPAPVPVPAVVAKVVPPAPVPQPAVVAKPVTPPAPVVVASVTPVTKPVPVPVQAAPAGVAKAATPPAVAVATVVPAAKPVATQPGAAQPGAAQPAPVAVVKAPVPTAPVAVATVVPAAKPVQVVPAPAPVAVATAKPVAAVPVAVAKPAVDPAVAKAAKALENDKEDVLKVVNAWARAWSARDVGNYLEYYAHDFQTPGGMSRKAWTEERYARIKGKGRISVSIENPQVTVSDKTATVVFRQVYVSDRMRANGRKTLLLVKQGGKWQIKQERAAS